MEVLTSKDAKPKTEKIIRRNHQDRNNDLELSWCETKSRLDLSKKEKKIVSILKKAFKLN